MKLTLELKDEVDGEKVTERPFLLASVNGEPVGLLTDVELTTDILGLPHVRVAIIDYSKHVPEEDRAKHRRCIELLESVSWIELEVIDLEKKWEDAKRVTKWPNDDKVAWEMLFGPLIRFKHKTMTIEMARIT